MKINNWLIIILFSLSLISSCFQNNEEKEVQSLLNSSGNKSFITKGVLINNDTITLNLVTNKIIFFEEDEYLILKLIDYTFDIDKSYYRISVKNDRANIHFQCELKKDINMNWNKKYIKSFVNTFEPIDFIKMNILIRERLHNMNMKFEGTFFELAKVSFNINNNKLYSTHLNTLVYIHAIDNANDFFEDNSLLSEKINQYWNSLNLNLNINEYGEKLLDYLDSNYEKSPPQIDI
ncbi:MAG: hypothetical protein ACJAY9_001351 [Flavobacteriales bacterium]|jgi:hypothetical protein